MRLVDHCPPPATARCDRHLRGNPGDSPAACLHEAALLTPMQPRLIQIKFAPAPEANIRVWCNSQMDRS